MRSKTWLTLVVGLPILAILALLVYQLPPVHDRLSWRIDSLRARVRYALNPPEEQVFIPQEQLDQIEAIVQATLNALTPVAESVFTTPSPPGLTATPQATPTPTLTPTPLPDSVRLSGITHEYQNFNNCGPANLSMVLSYWGWDGNQNVTREYLRPNYAGAEQDDKNVNPFEMVRFVESQTGLKALFRVGGDLHTLKSFVAAGFPVIIEKGLDPEHDAWLGHYQIINGYDEASQRFFVYDSLEGPDSDWPQPYEVVEQFWPHFNNVYIIVYAPEREAEVLALLGPQADPAYNYRYTAQQALEAAGALSGRDEFFAWFDRGSSLVGLGEYDAAAEAYDAAFLLNQTLPLDERPWRLLWYVDGPYAAYYHTGRYQDVITLANTTLTNVEKPILEETYYWRGMAYEALGDREAAVRDLQRAAQLNPNSTDAGAQLQRMGVASP